MILLLLYFFVYSVTISYPKVQATWESPMTGSKEEEKKTILDCLNHGHGSVTTRSTFYPVKFAGFDTTFPLEKNVLILLLSTRICHIFPDCENLDRVCYWSLHACFFISGLSALGFVGRFLSAMFMGQILSWERKKKRDGTNFLLISTLTGDSS